MDRVRREGMRRIGRLLMLASAGSASAVQGEGPVVVRINLPGPGSLPFLPIELIPRLRLDSARGYRLQLRYFPSGTLAAEDMLKGNADFAAHGFSILPALRPGQRPAVAVATLSGRDKTLGVLVRSDLARRIVRAEDLRGASIGVSTGNALTRTYLQMIGELVLAQYGVSPGDVRWVPMAQNWESVRSVLVSKAADAVVCEEPFLSRAVDTGLARMLLHANELPEKRRLPGEGHIRAVVSSVAARLDANQRDGKALVDMLDDALGWMAAAPVGRLLETLGIERPEEQAELARLLTRYTGLFPRRTQFSRGAIEATGTLLVAMGQLTDAADVARLFDDRWAGRS